MAAKISKPEVGDTISYHFEAYDTVLVGKVIDLLSKQFTISIQQPESFKDKTHFIFYDELWEVIDS